MIHLKTLTDLNKETSVSKVHNSDFNLNVKLSRIKNKQHDLAKNYELDKYLDLNKHTWNKEMRELIPNGTPEYLDNGEKYVERIGRALAYFKQCALIGPSGTGKTHIVYLVSELANLPLWEINCGVQTSVFDMFGRYIGLGKENWIDGLITSWCRYGGILYLDEANMMKQDVATRLNPLLDQRGHMVLTEKDSEIIPRHKHAYMIISMNPVSSEFSGTKPINAAMRRRMSVWLNFDYMSFGDKIDQKEIEMIAEKTGINKKITEVIVKCGAHLRELYKNGDLPYAPSIGDLVTWAKITSDNGDPKESANETIVSMTSDDPEIQDELRKIISKFFDN
ncbi:MAG: AAA family ATPase [Thaumarchaeota archaeon]|nr:AAA family ATPase [Nitrososphaerota archaeon]